MLTISILSLIVGVLALVGVYYTVLQVRMMVRDTREKKTWAVKHAEARRLVLLTSKCAQMSGGTAFGYNRVFPDPAFRGLIETYLIEMVQAERMVPRVLETDQLLLATVQTVIQQTLDTIGRFKHEHPEDAKHLGL